MDTMSPPAATPLCELERHRLNASMGCRCTHLVCCKPYESCVGFSARPFFRTPLAVRLYHMSGLRVVGLPRCCVAVLLCADVSARLFDDGDPVLMHLSRGVGCGASQSRTASASVSSSR